MTPAPETTATVDGFLDRAVSALIANTELRNNGKFSPGDCPFASWGAQMRNMVPAPRVWPVGPVEVAALRGRTADGTDLWIMEPKWNGHRCIAAASGICYSRHGKVLPDTGDYARAVQDACRRLGAEWLDGELLGTRVPGKARLVVFDAYMDGRLAARRAALEGALPVGQSGVELTSRLPLASVEWYLRVLANAASQAESEGVVLKRVDEAYLTATWRKILCPKA